MAEQPSSSQAQAASSSSKPVAKAAPAVGATPRNRAKAKPKAAPAPVVAAGDLVQYQTTSSAFMLPVKCGGKFTFVKSDKPSSFDKSKLKHQMLVTIAAEIKAGRLKEVQ
jgi:hypothetical protein